ncbi:MAG: bifunctional glutamate N-acetyltransferase/amino-acid acetyltransferase ArgJ [Baekduia sp.]
MSGFFSSRWVDVPDSVTDLGGDELAPGFIAGGAAAGIKPSGGLDVGLIAGPAETTSAIRLTASSAPAAPVLVTRERCRIDAIQAIVVNSGNANAATGRPGLDEAARMQGAAAIATGTSEDRVAVCSTGVIGVQLDGQAVMRGVLLAKSEMKRDGAQLFQQAMMTTDRTEKRCRIEVELPDGTVTITAQCKGAGMIQPNFATMLCFVQTDAVISAETADLLLGVCVQRSFDRVTVDGQLSTNDTVIVQASGYSGVEVEPESQAEAIFGQALDAVLRQLAIAMIADGEGAARIGRVIARGGDGPAVERVARAVANSPLVKTAMNGGDPNWGRILQAVGGALPGPQSIPVDIAIEGTLVCSAGAAVPVEREALVAAVSGTEVEYEITLPGGGYETEVLFSDLGHGYVTINAEYTT